MLNAVKKAVKRSLFGHSEFFPSFSLAGEDMLLRYLFADFATGVYVDIGACHPSDRSNTAWFHLRGWRGVNVEPRPGSLALFRRERPNDDCFECAVSSRPGRMSYLVHADAQADMNGCDPDFQRRLGHDPSHLGCVAVQARTLAEILSASPTVRGGIDFLSIDIEGAELDALNSNDWSRFRPKAILLESFESLESELAGSETRLFLKGTGYALRYKTPNSSIYLRDDVPLSPIGRIAP